VMVVVLALGAVACSGGGATGRQRNDALPDGGTPSAGSTIPGATPTATPSGGIGSLVAGGGGGTGGAPSPVTGYPIPHLFTAAEDRIGFTSSRIAICMHAPLNLAAVFNVDADDLNVYWRYVNAELGGIYGRKVDMTYADDKYGATPADVRTAYDTCHDRRPFILTGGFGIDQVPQVRTYAEQDHQLYFHNIGREDFTKKYSFSFLPSVETTGTRAAQWVLHAHPGQSIGVVYRDSENWEPGHAKFKAELALHGRGVDADLPVAKNATVYTTQIRTLKNRQVKVVFLWENALSAIEIIKQADQQQYHPQWLIFPFNIITDKLDNAMVDPVPVEGIAMWPAYRPHDTSGTYSAYAGEIRFFERIHAKYSSGPTDDITWMTWLAWREVHKLLLDCGPDCTRNKIVGLLQSGAHKPPFGCLFNFAANGHVGAFAVNVLEAYMAGGNGAWKNLELCKASF